MVNATTHSDQHAHNDAGSRSLAPSTSEVTLPSSSTSATRAGRSTPNTAAPAIRTFFDPWNSSSTGHQRAENRLSGSTSWRDSRNLKLGEQYRGGLTGGKRLADTVGAGSTDFGKDGRKPNGGWEKGAKGLRTGGQKSLAEAWGSKKYLDGELEKTSSSEHLSVSDFPEDEETDIPPSAQVASTPVSPSAQPGKQLFAGLCFYVNGSTAPLVSDHKLKRMLAAHGASSSISFGRRSVTHVILGSTTREGGAGGGLAASKIQKEIARAGGRPVKFITAEWVLESIKADRRQPESRFSPLKLASQSQNSVVGLMREQKATSSKRSQP